VAERIVCGLSTRKYRRAVQSVLDGYGIRKSSVSRHFVRATAEQLRALCERRLEKVNLVALLIAWAFPLCCGGVFRAPTSSSRACPRCATSAAT
jgi:hypothetical protein